MFRRVNKQPGIHAKVDFDAVTIKKSMTEFHH